MPSEYQGQLDPALIWNADNYLTGSYFDASKLPVTQARTNQLPLSLALVNFPNLISPCCTAAV